jgi:hypothetical protein
MKKSLLITLTIILGVIIFAVIMRNTIHNGVSQNIAECIGQNSILYIQLGCHACENQEKLFGDKYQYINVIDCFYEKDECINVEITKTPTWIINGKKYIGIQSIEELKKLTGC